MYDFEARQCRDTDTKESSGDPIYTQLPDVEKVVTSYRVRPIDRPQYN